MQLMDILAQTGGLQSMARELGVSEQEAQNGASALAPALMDGFQRQSQSTGAASGGLGGLLGQLGGGSLLDNVLSPQPTDLSQGNNVLGHIFGSKDASRLSSVTLRFIEARARGTGTLSDVLAFIRINWMLESSLGEVLDLRSVSVELACSELCACLLG